MLYFLTLGSYRNRFLFFVQIADHCPLILRKLPNGDLVNNDDCGDDNHVATTEWPTVSTARQTGSYSLRDKR